MIVLRVKLLKTIKIDLEKRFSKKIGLDSIANILFSEIAGYDKVILDFKNIEFISMSFAQEYVYQRYYSKIEIIEINKNDFVDGLLKAIEKEFKKTFVLK